MPSDPVPLHGGYVNEVVRVGDTVRRSQGDRAAYVHRLLRHLEAADHPAPRLLGIDEDGREILSFVAGEVPTGPAAIENVREERSIEAVARLVRRLHDVTEDSELAEGAEVVCHNDLSPKNTVYDRTGGWWRPVALIDWDLAGPGRRVHDVAHLCWQYVGLGPDRSDADEAARLVRVACDAYGLTDRAEVVDTILWWQDRCADGIERFAAEGDQAMQRLRDAGVPREVRQAAAWVRRHRGALESALR
jgi:aminoglycoside phosphotransferase (APT) family kinase protein